MVFQMVQKTYDKPMKGESAKMFARFQIYLKLAPEERSYRKVAEILNEKSNHKNSQNVNNRQKVTEETLRKNAEKWCWKIRAELYDADMRIQQMEKDKAEFNAITDEIIQSYKSIVTQCKNMVQEIAEKPYKTNGEPYSLASKIKMLYELGATLKVANEQVRLAYGYSTTNNDINIDANVNADVGITTEEALKENEDSISRFISRRLKKTD